ncbi:MAG: hypothetical protein FWC06_06650 [Treponema sp.]|nr:hypothetical protein [Treponema sp.]
MNDANQKKLPPIYEILAINTVLKSGLNIDLENPINHWEIKDGILNVYFNANFQYITVNNITADK